MKDINGEICFTKSLREMENVLIKLAVAENSIANKNFPVCSFEYTDLSKPICTRLDRVVILEGPHKGNYPATEVLVKLNPEDSGFNLRDDIKADKCIQLIGDRKHDLSKYPITDNPVIEDDKEYIRNSRFEGHSLVYVTEEELDKHEYIQVESNGLILTRLYQEWIKARAPMIDGMYRLPIIQFENGLVGELPRLSCKAVYRKMYKDEEKLFVPKDYIREQFCTTLVTSRNEKGECHQDTVNLNRTLFINRITAIPLDESGKVDLSIVSNISVCLQADGDMYTIGSLSQGQHEVYGEKGDYLSYIFHPINLKTYNGIDLLQSPYRATFEQGFLSTCLAVSYRKKGSINIYIEGHHILRYSQGMIGFSVI
jgi:hypothetical protein